MGRVVALHAAVLHVESGWMCVDSGNADSSSKELEPEKIQNESK